MEIYFLSGWSVPVIRQLLGWAARILLVCGLLFGLATGINWLTHQPWGSGQMSFGCTGGAQLHWRYTKTRTILWCP